MAKRKGKAGRDARREAQLARLARSGDGEAGAERRERTREAATDAAHAVPSAARWWVPDAGPDGAPVTTGASVPRAVAVDVVADLLALGPGPSLRGRGGDDLRRLAARTDGLLAAHAVAPSGRPLLEVVVADPAARAPFEPTFDLDALLADGPVAGSAHDRTVRLAEALAERAEAHRAGAVDLHAEVAPIGRVRHARADELETLVRVATDGLVTVAGPDPAIVTVTGGWVGVSPVELFLGAAAGLLDGAARDVGGAALATWLGAVARDGTAPWWEVLTARVPVDAAALLADAATRAGSDHPDVVGGVLVELVALRHPSSPGA